MKFKTPYIISEIGVNYYDIAKKKNISNMEAAKLMIKKAKQAGSDAVKFQSYKADTIASKNSPAYWDTKKEPTRSQFELFKKFDKFDKKEYEKLANYAKSLKIDFLCTPFDYKSVEYLDKIVPAFKISSSDITNFPLIEKIVKKGKPIYQSVGASTIKEIRETINFMKSINNKVNVTLLHCVLNYPTLNENSNLNRISILKEKFPTHAIGYSDHTLPDHSMNILTTATLLGVTVVEKHFTLDKTIPGNDHYHSMDPKDLKIFIKNCLVLEKIFSKNEKDYLPSEKKSRKEARRSLVAIEDIEPNEIITNKMLISKRPAHGISPKDIKKVIGKKAKKKILADEIIKWIILK